MLVTNSKTGKKRVRISVLIVTFQHERYIAQCIESVLSQDVEADLEVLIGEDGSTDDTLRICLEFASDPRVRVFAHARAEPKIRIEGYTTGRANLLDLMARAKGDLVIRIDGDDHWNDKGKLRAQLKLLEENPTFMGCYHQTTCVDPLGQPIGDFIRTGLPDQMGYEDTIQPLSPFHVSSFLYRNLPQFRHLPVLAEQVGSLDMLLFAIVAHEGPLIRADGPMSSYRLHEKGITREGLFARTNILRLRILMWTGMIRSLKGAGQAKAYAVCDEHLQNAQHHPISRLDACRWVMAVIRRPEYFFGRLDRIRMIVRIVRRSGRLN
jgi:glycosyltransferase involved in cell wall biosynthesis